MSEPTRHTVRWDVVALAAIAAASIFFVWSTLSAPRGSPSWDIYGAQYPMFVHAWRSLRRGHGLLWNSVQNCGQPFLPSTPPGTLYPLNPLFLAVGLDHAWPAAAVVHLVIGGAGVYGLGRTYGIARVAALSGACVFAFSGDTLNLAGWLPTANLGAYAWLPVAMLCVERLLERPTAGRGLALGTVLSLQLMAGCPQIWLFTYQLIPLRLVWHVLTSGARQLGPILATLLLGLALPAALAAVSLFPSLEFARLSVRSRPLELTEIQPGGPMDWPQLARMLFPPIGNRLMTVATLALAAAAPAASGRWRVAGFYLCVVGLSVLLVMNERVLAVYMDLPFGRAFRFPRRFAWITWFALSVLAGLGAEALLAPGGPPRRWRWVVAAGAALLGALAFSWLSAGRRHETLWLVLPVVLVPPLVAASGERARPRVLQAAGLGLAAALLVDLYLASRAPFLTFQPAGAALRRNADAFKFVKSRMTPLDRLLTYRDAPDMALMAKSASVFGIPSVLDYEPQTSQRYADLRVMAVTGHRVKNINEFNFATVMPFSRPALTNLLAARWLVIATKGPQFQRPRWVGPRHELRWQRDNVAVFENLDALPRAYYVPQLEVVKDATVTLGRLASAGYDPRRAALVEERPADGFLGSNASATGDVSLVDRSERVTLRVRAPQPGFVVLTDQDYPGWNATVDGVPAPILRANYAFRAVRVPRGRSVVEFRYRPWTVWLGLATSLATATGLLVFVVVHLRRTAGARSGASDLTGIALGARQQ